MILLHDPKDASLFAQHDNDARFHDN